MPLDPALEPLLATFLSESQRIVATASKRILELERSADGAQPDAEACAEVARGLHTLKGTSGTFGLEDLTELAHRMEDLFDPIKRSRERLSPAIADALLRGLDVFLARVRGHTEGKGDSLPDLGETIALLRQASPGGIDVVEIVALGAEADDADDPEAGSWRVATGDVVSIMQEVERLRELRLRLELRVAEIGRSAELVGSAPVADLRALLLDLRRGLAAERDEAADIVSALEGGVKAICTLPIRTVLDPLHRSVRDLCRQTGKMARLAIVGGEISLDRRLLEALRGPLVHLVRNAIDHGIEPPEVREARGKHREGALTIRVDQRGNILVLELSDDGQGIDAAQVGAEAVRRGIVEPGALPGMSPGEVCRLVFRAGLSTRRDVTETSGRGVGLDVVRARVLSLRGHVDLETIAGQGTRFLLTLPSALGSSAAIVVRVGEQQLGVPMHAIALVVAARRERLTTDRTRTMLEHEGRSLPVEDLGALLGLRQARAPADGEPLLLMESPAGAVAVAVDEILHDVDLVIRPLPMELLHLPAYQGAATTISGELLLVLRPEWLTGHDPARAVVEPRRALVVDDSITARALHRTVLEAAGFVVHGASSAEEALEHLAHTSYDVAVCDIAMSGMGGVELCAALQRRSDTRAMPVLLVSAREETSICELAIEAGAAGFLTKRECASGRLIELVSSVVRRREAPA